MIYDGKYLYIDDENNVRKKYDNKIKTTVDTVEKQPFILPGVYDGLWSAYTLVIIFENGNKSEGIKTIEGIRGINCDVKVIVTDDGTIHIDG